MEINRDDIIRMAQAVWGDDSGKPWHESALVHLEAFAALAYAEGHKDGLDDFEAVVLPAAIKAEREACAKVCHDKAWELKERAMKETVKTQRARLTSEAVGWHDAFTAIRARGQE